MDLSHGYNQAVVFFDAGDYTSSAQVLAKVMAEAPQTSGGAAAARPRRLPLRTAAPRGA